MNWIPSFPRLGDLPPAVKNKIKSSFQLHESYQRDWEMSRQSISASPDSDAKATCPTCWVVENAWNGIKHKCFSPSAILNAHASYFWHIIYNISRFIIWCWSNQNRIIRCKYQERNNHEYGRENENKKFFLELDCYQTDWLWRWIFSEKMQDMKKICNWNAYLGFLFFLTNKTSRWLAQ